MGVRKADMGDSKEARNLEVHTWVKTQRIQLGREGHPAYGPWAIHRDVEHQLMSYIGGSRSCQKGDLLITVSAKHCSSCSQRRWLGPLP